jgi:hypothetical protein
MLRSQAFLAGGLCASAGGADNHFHMSFAAWQPTFQKPVWQHASM